MRSWSPSSKRSSFSWRHILPTLNVSRGLIEQVIEVCHIFLVRIAPRQLIRGLVHNLIGVSALAMSTESTLLANYRPLTHGCNAFHLELLMWASKVLPKCKGLLIGSRHVRMLTLVIIIRWGILGTGRGVGPLTDGALIEWDVVSWLLSLIRVTELWLLSSLGLASGWRHQRNSASTSANDRLLNLLLCGCMPLHLFLFDGMQVSLVCFFEWIEWHSCDYLRRS